MKHILYQEIFGKAQVVISMKVFDEDDLDGMAAAAITVDDRVYTVPDDVCGDSKILCDYIQALTAEKKFTTFDTIQRIVNEPIKFEEGDLL